MAVTAAELTVGFNADTSDLKKGTQQAQSMVSSFIANTAAGLATNVFMSAAGGVKSLAVGMVTANAAAETMRQSLDIATGSMERGGKIFGELQKLAANTPFEFPELMQSAIALESLGTNAMDYMDVLGNTAAATGKSLDQVTQAFLDAQTGEFERLKEFGIRASVEGDKVLFSYMTAQGQVTKEVEKGNTAMYQSTLEAIWNSKYAGAMETQSKTFNGMWSTLKDNFSLLMQEMGKPLFEFVKGGIAAFNQFFTVFNGLRQKGVNIFQAMWTGIRKALKGALGKDNPIFLFIRNAKREVVTLVNAFREGGWAGLGRQILTDLWGAFQGVWPSVVNWATGTAIPALVTAFGAAKTYLGDKVPEWMAALTTKLGELWPGVVGWITGVGIPAVVGAVGAAKDFLGEKIPEWTSAITTKLVEVWPTVSAWLMETGIPAVLTAIGTGATLIPTKILEWAPAVIAKLEETWPTVQTWITETGIPNLITKLGEFKDKIGPEVILWAGKIKDTFIEEFPKFLTWIAEEGVPDLVVKGGELIGGIVQGITDHWDEITGWIKENGWNLLLGALALPITLGATAGAIVVGIKNGMVDIWENQLYPWIEDTIGWTGWTNFFTGAGDWLLDAGKNIIQGLWDGVTEKWDGFIKDIQSKIDLMPGVVKKVLGIESPSKVFRELGENTMQGFADGINHGSKRAVDEMQRAARSLPGLDASFRVSASGGASMRGAASAARISRAAGGGIVVNAPITINGVANGQDAADRAIERLYRALDRVAAGMA